MRNFKDLRVWIKAHQLAMEIYRLTKPFPDDERFGITSQLRRAAISIPTNISEGCGRNGEAELARFVSIAAGSASEVEYLIFASYQLKYISDDNYHSATKATEEVKKMLSSFHSRLKEGDGRES